MRWLSVVGSSMFAEGLFAVCDCSSALDLGMPGSNGLWNVQPETELPMRSPSNNSAIPFVNIRMEFNLDLSNLTFQLGQQIMDVVLQHVPATSNYEALLYTEQGSTSQSRFIYITAKFYDGDVSQVNSLLRDAPYLVRQSHLMEVQIVNVCQCNHPKASAPNLRVMNAAGDAQPEPCSRQIHAHHIFVTEFDVFHDHILRLTQIDLKTCRVKPDSCSFQMPWDKYSPHL